MIDLKKLGRIGLDSSDQQKVDTVLNVDHRPLISQYNNRFIKYGFVEVKDNKYNLNITLFPNLRSYQFVTINSKWSLSGIQINYF